MTEATVEARIAVNESSASRGQDLVDAVYRDHERASFQDSRTSFGTCPTRGIRTR